MTSFKEWCEKHYPIEASELKDATPLEAIRHSLNKWKGLRPDVLAAHGLEIDASDSPLAIKKIGYNSTLLEVSGETCSLCVMAVDCGHCPFQAVFHDTCDDYLELGGKSIDPWMAWVDDQNPGPMIMALEMLESRYSQQVEEVD